MRLSRKKAIELCIELWTWLAKTGKQKSEWPDWDKYDKYNIPIGSTTLFDCWFCEYGMQQKNGFLNLLGGHQENCDKCPYFRKYGKCFSEDGGKVTYYDKWEYAKTPRTRKKYAKLFLEQIRTLEKK